MAFGDGRPGVVAQGGTAHGEWYVNKHSENTRTGLALYNLHRRCPCRPNSHSASCHTYTRLEAALRVAEGHMAKHG